MKNQKPLAVALYKLLFLVKIISTSNERLICNLLLSFAYICNQSVYPLGRSRDLLFSLASSLHAPTSKQPGAPVNPGDRLTSYQPSWLPGTHCLFTFPAGAGILQKPQSLFIGLQKECHVHDPLTFQSHLLPKKQKVNNKKKNWYKAEANSYLSSQATWNSFTKNPRDIANGWP